MLFADQSSEVAGWLTAAGLLLAGGYKFILDLRKDRAKDRETDRDKTVAGLEAIINHANDNAGKMELRIREMEKREDRSEHRWRMMYRRHAQCEKHRARDQGRMAHLESELIRNGINFAPYKPEDTDEHSPLEKDHADSDLDSDDFADEGAS